MGEVFAGRYELVDPIGSGGMGSVWRTFDHRENTFCAAKVLRQSDAATVLRFIREQSLRIRHPHVVAPRNWAGEDDRVLFTMDLVCGGSAATVLHDHGPLPSNYVAVLLEQLLAALDAVHRAGVVHRDVKPSNLLLEPTGIGRPFARLTDFGIAVKRDEPRLTSTGLVLGTPGYMAPEAYAGVDPEPRQDLYMAGSTGIELLTGMKPPNTGSGDDQVPETPPYGVDSGLWRLLRALCAADPDARPSGAGDARDRLLRLPDERQPAEPLVAPAARSWHPGVEPVEVFDQVGPLPAQWSPRPGIAPAAGQPARTGAPAGPAPAGAPGQGAPGAGPPGPGAVGHGRSAGGDVPRTAVLSGGDPAGSSHTMPITTSTGAGPRRRRRWPLLLATVAIGAVVGLASTQLPWPQADQQSGGAESKTETNGGLADGDRCSFVEVGARVDGAEGNLTCEKTSGGEYRWSAG